MTADATLPARAAPRPARGGRAGGVVRLDAAQPARADSRDDADLRRRRDPDPGARPPAPGRLDRHRDARRGVWDRRGGRGPWLDLQPEPVQRRTSGWPAVWDQLD